MGSKFYFHLFNFVVQLSNKLRRPQACLVISQRYLLNNIALSQCSFTNFEDCLIPQFILLMELQPSPSTPLSTSTLLNCYCINKKKVAINKVKHIVSQYIMKLMLAYCCCFFSLNHDFDLNHLLITCKQIRVRNKMEHEHEHDKFNKFLYYMYYSND